MSGKEESLLEKILKPIRINPITLGASIACFGLGSLGLGLSESNNTLAQLASISAFALGGSPLFIYFKYGVKNYFRDKTSLISHGFDRRYGKLRMSDYCDRQAYYVACVETGFREEVRALIRDTPAVEKREQYLPHI